MLSTMSPRKAQQNGPTALSIIVVFGPSTVVAADSISVCSVNTSDGTNAASASTYVFTPGAAVVVLAPG